MIVVFNLKIRFKIIHLSGKTFLIILERIVFSLKIPLKASTARKDFLDQPGTGDYSFANSNPPTTADGQPLFLDQVSSFYWWQNSFYIFLFQGFLPREVEGRLLHRGRCFSHNACLWSYKTFKIACIIYIVCGTKEYYNHRIIVWIIWGVFGAMFAFSLKIP